MEQFQITSRPRHLRYVFFVDENYPCEKLLSLIHVNQKIWGGRYNPIVPVKDNIISDCWKEILRHYDPDFVFYSKEIESETIKKLRIFNPCGYYNLDEKPIRGEVTGVSSFFLLSEFHSKSNIILTAGIHGTESPLLPYYKTNFGFEENLINHEVELSQDLNRKIIGEKEFEFLNKFICELRPINQSHLSRKNLNTVILRSKNYTNNYPFEIVIAKDKSSNVDLFYFWNRMLFELRNILYVTVEELNLLCKDEYFGQVLFNMDWSTDILVTSQSLTKEEVQEIIDQKLGKIKTYRRFENGRNENFPFEVLDSNGLFEREYGEVPTVQTINSRYGIYHLPKLSFISQYGHVPQGWAIDIQIKSHGNNDQNILHLPLTTETHFIINSMTGRVNKSRNISAIIYKQQNTSDTLDLKIPNFRELLDQLITRPVIDGEAIDTKYDHIGLHDDSNKLSAFLKSFDYDFSVIDDFFTDKLWVSIFEELATSNKATGNSISLEGILDKCRVELASIGKVELDSNGKLAGNKGETFKYEKNLDLGIKSTMDELCNYKVFLKGFNLKCVNCSSQFWYHINEVKETVNCKGCHEGFTFPIEPRFSYKLNDLIRNNIFQLDGARNGNLAVIRTIVSMHRKSYQSFYYSPQLNLYDGHHTNKPCAEIDIVCLSNGQLVIGEVKHDSKAFSANSNKALLSLVEIAKAIRPDKIILTCYVDTNEKLAKAKQGLIHYLKNWEYQPKIEVWQLHTPDNLHTGNYRYFYY